jgi:hypothetical protein
MVVYLTLVIKMGRGPIDLAGLPSRSARQSQHQQKGAVQFLGRFRVNAADNPAYAIATERDQFVGHDLRPKAKTVFRCNFNQRSEQKSVLQVRRDRTDEDCRKAGAKPVVLNDDTGPRPPEIARNDHQHDIAARYFHDFQS